MKSLLLIYENAAGEPADELDGRTPLQVARCPAATRLASEGLCGVLARVPSGEGARAEALLAALMGVPRADAWRLARGPLEAEAVGADWATYPYAYRADLVTMDEGVMRDGCLVNLTRAETDQLVGTLQDALDALPARIKTVDAGHAVVMVQQDEAKLDIGFAPWLVKGVDEVPRPEGKRAQVRRKVMERAVQALDRQTINDVRVDLGENPVNALWLWGGGPQVELLEKFGGRPLKGIMLTQSAMAHGLAMSLGLPVDALASPCSASDGTAVVDAEYMAKLFKAYDVVVVYVEAPPELIRGSAADKVRMLERMDLLLTDPLLEAVKKVKHRRFVLATVPAASDGTQRARGPVLPVAVWGAHVVADEVLRWDEISCAEGELKRAEPTEVFGRLVGG